MSKKIFLGLMLMLVLFLAGCGTVKINDEDLAKEANGKMDSPRICTMEYAPVCGVDGNTYGNKCGAGDVEIAYVGECGDSEAMIASKEMVACTREYMPVCGADGITYSNKCEAGKMAIAYEGGCTTSEGSPELVGDDKDEHGCIGSAGYVWSEDKQECVRPWEEN